MPYNILAWTFYWDEKKTILPGKDMSQNKIQRNLNNLKKIKQFLLRCSKLWQKLLTITLYNFLSFIVIFLQTISVNK